VPRTVADDESVWLDEEWDEPEPVISPPPPLAHRFEHARTVMTSSGSNEWYTPAHLIERARTFLGAIDLDPASSERANETVQAQRFYDARTDGLAQHWTGRIWLNPPYGDEASKFVAKAIREYQAGNATEVLLLLKAATDTGWFRPLFDYPMCFIYGRISFVTGDGSESATATFPSVVVYLGQHYDEFRACFSEIGAVMRRIDGLQV
jgi:phage N-6-adenine-methyltransferase